jgi:hypothetical protein
LKDPFFRVPDPTSAIVTRIDPEGVEGVAELKVYDGTNRLGWVESRNLVSVRVAMNLIPSAKVNPDGTYASNYGIPNGFVAKRRQRVPPDFSAVDAAISSMGQATMEQSRQDRIRTSFALRNNLLPGAAVPGIGVPSSSGIGSARQAASSGGVSPGSRSSGYYYGPRQPPGRYVGGQGSAHRGGHYENPYTGDRYQAGSNRR